MACADRVRQLALLRAHPELAGRAAQRGELTAHSSREQAGSGLLGGPSPEVARLRNLNRAYAARFGFPVLLGVRGLVREDTHARLAQRPGNSSHGGSCEGVG